jgi:uncharacterized membrane protein YedE/YeeE
MIEFLSQPWPWWVVGIVIAITMFALLWAGNNFGVSASLRTACAAFGAGKRYEFFNFDWKRDGWNLVFILGTILGGAISATLLRSGDVVHISQQTVSDLQALGVSTDPAYLVPQDIFSWDALLSLRGIVFIVVGGFLVGFGARYAGGCTSGHAISGLSNLQLPSLIAVIGFFIGGLLVTHLLLPYLLKL